MWLNPFPVIWRSEPVRIELPPDSAAALESVRERLPAWSLRMWFRDGAIGRVSESRIQLKRYRPLRRNDFAPLLDAEVRDADGTRALVGAYRASWPTRIFLSLWFGVAILFIPLFLIFAIMSYAATGPTTEVLRTGSRGIEVFANDVSRVVFMVGPLLLFLIGRGILAVSERHWDADKRYLEEFVRESWTTGREG
jgi:hypothetical protein